MKTKSLFSHSDLIRGLEERGVHQLNGISYVIRAVIRERHALWEGLVILMLTAIPAAIVSTSNYLNLFVNASAEVLTRSSKSHLQLTSTYLVAKASEGNKSVELNLICNSSFSEGLLLSRDLREDLHVNVGDEILISTPSSRKGLRVSGFVLGTHYTAYAPVSVCNNLGGGTNLRESSLLKMRLNIINGLKEELNALLNCWIAIASLVLFSASIAIFASMVKKLGHAIKIIREQGCSFSTLLLGMVIGSILIAIASTFTGMGLGLILAQLTFKLGSSLGILAPLNPFMLWSDMVLFVCMNALIVSVASAGALIGMNRTIKGESF